MAKQSKYNKYIGQNKGKLSPAIYNLRDYDIYFEDDPKNPKIFRIEGLPRFIAYGKTGFWIGYVDLDNEQYSLVNNSEILLEVKDANGVNIYSDIVETDPVSGYTSAFFRVDEDPDNTYDPITDGIGYITLVGEMENVPPDWQGNYNCRISYPIEIVKDFDNRSQIFFDKDPDISADIFSVDDSTIATIGKKGGTLPSVVRTYAAVEVDGLDTVGGEVSYIDLSYKSSALGKAQFQTLDVFPVNHLELLTESSSATINSNHLGDFTVSENLPSYAFTAWRGPW